LRSRDCLFVFIWHGLFLFMIFLVFLRRGICNYNTDFFSGKTKDMSLAANAIYFLHMLLVAWIVITPFQNSEPMLVLHLFSMPFLWLHWLMNDDTCCLTIVECKLRGIEPTDAKNKSFFFNLVSPVYKIQDADVRQLAWVLSIVLWLITLHKVLKRPDMIKEMFVNAKRAFKGEPPILPQEQDVARHKFGPEGEVDVEVGGR